MELAFRPAVPDDADDVVPLMHESSRGLIDAVFAVPGRAVEDFLSRDFSRGQGLFGYRNQCVAVTGDGRVVASVTSYPGRRWRSLSLRTFRTGMAHHGPRELAGICRRSAATGSLFTPPQPTGLFLANLAVAREHRDRGVATRLAGHLLRQAGDQGYSVVELDVSEGNAGARRLYERLGFEVVGRREDRSGLGLDAFQRMRAATGAAVVRPGR